MDLVMVNKDAEKVMELARELWPHAAHINVSLPELNWTNEIGARWTFASVSGISSHNTFHRSAVDMPALIERLKYDLSQNKPAGA